MKKCLSAVLLFVFLFLSFTVPAGAEDVSASARAFVLYCADNGEVLLSQASDEKLPMASTTKIMTSLIALEYAAGDNKTVTFTEEMTAEGSSMYLKVGEQVTLYDLAVGMMMQSGNDAANAAAIAIAGSIEAFAVIMNQKAEEIGMAHTHFVTPSGLDDPEHYSTAYDMALLMAYAMQNQSFADITSHTSMTVDFIYPEDKSVTYSNHNRLLSLYDSCVGGKTGYTGASGRCLVTAAQRDGLTLIAVTLDDRDDWNDHIALFDYGFDRYTLVRIEADTRYTIDVVGGEEDTVGLSAEEAVSVVIPREKAEDIRQTVYLPSFVYAPIRQGAEAGWIRYTLDGDTVGELSLCYTESVDYLKQKRDIITYIKDLFHWHN